MTALGQLIEDVRTSFLDRHGVALSYDAIARRGGAVVTGSYIHALATGPVKRLPPNTTLMALARGLEVPYRLVFEAALISAGYALPTTLATENREIG